MPLIVKCNLTTPAVVLLTLTRKIAMLSLKSEGVEADWLKEIVEPDRVICALLVPSSLGSKLPAVVTWVTLPDNVQLSGLPTVQVSKEPFVKMLPEVMVSPMNSSMFRASLSKLHGKPHCLQ